MLLRDIWGHPLFVREAPEGGGGAPPVPGTGEAHQAAGQQPPPAASEPSAAQPPPGPVPYARFKEVNDARRELEETFQPYRDLEEAGYEPADLQRLATWEQEYIQDPVGTWLRQAEQIEQLPESVKAAVAEALGTQGQPSADGAPSAAAAGQQQDDEVPEWGRRLLEDHEARSQREQAEAISAFYDGLVDAWKKLDEQQGVATPEEAIHAHIAAASPNAASAEELLRTARETFLATREAILGSAIRVPGRDGTVPRSVPGSGAASGSAPPLRPKTLAEAKRMALADPSIGGASQ